MEKERAALKKLKAKIDHDKQELRADRKKAEDFRYSEPARYKQQAAVLERVQKNMERTIDQFNDRFSKLQQVEKKLKAAAK